MSQFLDYVEAQLDPLMNGSDGARKLTADRFRRSIDNASLRDPAYPPNGFDRAYEYEWDSSGTMQGTDNPFDGSEQEEVFLNLNVGYVYGVAAANQVSTTGSEVAATAVKHARKRALSDAKMIERVLTWGPNYTGNLGSSVEWILMERSGPTTITDLGGGRLIATSRYRIVIGLDPAADYSP